jgi:hypothetical protein
MVCDPKPFEPVAFMLVAAPPSMLIEKVAALGLVTYQTLKVSTLIVGVKLIDDPVFCVVCWKIFPPISAPLDPVKNDHPEPNVKRPSFEILFSLALLPPPKKLLLFAETKGFRSWATRVGILVGTRLPVSIPPAPPHDPNIVLSPMKTHVAFPCPVWTRARETLK